MATLTRNDVNKIVYKFDQAHFPDVAKPASKVEAAREYIRINRWERLSTFPLELVDRIIRHWLMTAPSVGALLMYYRGSPTLSRLQPPITLNSNCLEGASKALLMQLRKEPTQERVELACFKQLMTLVFEEHFRGLGLDGQLAMVKKIQGATWELSDVELPANNNLFLKLNQLQQRLQMNQAGWDYTKVRLQLASWKVQLMIAHVLSSFGARVCLVVGSGYCAVRTYFWVKPVSNKIAYVFGRKFYKLIKYGLRQFGVDPHARGGSFPFKAFIILTTLMLSSVIGVAYLVARIHILCKDRFPPLLLDIVEWPFVTVSELISNPVGIAVGIGFGIYNMGESLTAHVVRSMDKAAVTASQKQYIQDKMPSLKDKWHQLMLNAPLQI